MALQVHDPLYGAFEIREPISELLWLPEVQRLSQVRLLNTPSPSLATLGELRRYSHTLGVLRLSLESPAAHHNQSLRHAMLAAVLLHDVGTPPLGHLVEYQLRERFSFDHETKIRPLLWGRHAPENVAHQIFRGLTIEFRRTIQQLGIALETVEEIVEGRHPAGRLIFGSLDLDNIDNVFRMGWALGLRADAKCALRLAARLDSDSHGLILARSSAADVRTWLKLRRQVYELVVFDCFTVASQAILTECIAKLFEQGELDEAEWVLTDEQLLDLLAEHPSTKLTISKHFLRRLPSPLFTIQIDGEAAESGRRGSGICRETVQAALDAVLPEDSPMAYVYRDVGAFSKELRFRDPTDGAEWSIGETSNSIIIYGFSKAAAPPSRARCRSAARTVLQEFEIPPERLLRVSVREGTTASHEQLSLVEANPGD